MNSSNQPYQYVDPTTRFYNHEPISGQYRVTNVSQQPPAMIYSYGDGSSYIQRYMQQPVHSYVFQPSQPTSLIQQPYQLQANTAPIVISQQTYERAPQPQPAAQTYGMTTNIALENPGSFVSTKTNNEQKNAGETAFSTVSPGKRSPTNKGSRYRGFFPQQQKTNNVLYKDIDLKKFTQEDFDIGPKVGKGKYGDVYLAKHKKTNFIMAMKVLDKMVLRQMRVQRQLIREIKFHWYLKHKNVVPLYGIFHDEDRVYMLMEYADRGDVYKELKQSPDKRLTEAKAAQYIKQVLEATIFLHSHDIIHRDLKPDNLLNCDGVIKLADFGWSVLVEKSSKRKTFCGTLDYMPPEMVSGDKYDSSVDNWSIGVMTYEFIAGTPPFGKESQQETLESIAKSTLDFDRAAFSEEAKDFISGLLNPSATKRLSLKNAINHPWITKHCNN